MLKIKDEIKVIKEELKYRREEEVENSLIDEFKCKIAKKHDQWIHKKGSGYLYTIN